MPANDDKVGSQTITLKDFTAGIFSNGNYATSVIPAPLGAAQITNTYRCVGLRAGGLGPLPAVTSLVSTNPGAGTAPYRVIGMDAFPITDGANGVGDRLFVLMTDSSTPRRLYARVFKTSSAGAITATTNYTWNTQAFLSLTGITLGANADLGMVMAPFQDSIVAVNQSGTPRVALLSFPYEDTGFKTDWYSSSASAFTSFTYTAFGLYGVVAKHQGRLLGLLVWDSAGTESYLIAPEISYSPVSPVVTALAAKFLTLFEGLGIGSWGSISVGEFFIVNRSGGALSISGDLDNPSITVLKGVKATGKQLGPGASTSSGLMYLTDDSVEMWNGSNSSTNVGRQIQAQDLVPQATSFSSRPDYYSRTYWSEPWDELVLFSNSYVYNLELNSWWRLDQAYTTGTPSFLDNSIFASADNNNMMYVADCRSGSNVQISLLDKRVPATSWSWQSQPINLGVNDELIDITDVEIAGVGSVVNGGTFTVTLIADDGTTQAETFTLGNTLYPARFRKPTAIRTHNLIVRIQADSGSSSPAPTLHQITFTYHPSTPTSTVV